MDDFYKQAEEKLKAALPGIRGPKEGAIKKAAMDALLNFAGQEPEFAQAIVQGGSFSDCMTAVCKGIGTRPQTVAYERDERAIQEAVEAERARQEKERAEAVARAANEAADAERAKHAAGEKEAKARIKELEDRIKLAAATKETIEKELKEAQAKAAAAEKAGADSAVLSEQVETLKKQLALAAPEVADFKAAFDRAQDELVHMNKALHEIRDEEIREKLRKACSAMLAGFMERVAG